MAFPMEMKSLPVEVAASLQTGAAYARAADPGLLLRHPVASAYSFFAAAPASSLARF
jgi:hypothetical protein